MAPCSASRGCSDSRPQRKTHGAALGRPQLATPARIPLFTCSPAKVYNSMDTVFGIRFYFSPLRPRSHRPPTSSISPQMPSMNLDVLVNLMSFLPQRDLLSMLLVNRACYWEAANLLAAKADFTHRPLTEETIPSYAQFLARDETTRGSYLRHFNVQFWDDVSYDVGMYLACILACCPNIVCLRLTQCESLILSLDLAISLPVLFMKGLTEVCFEDVGYRWVEAVCSELDAPLLRATVMFIEGSTRGALIPDATGLFSRCAGTLQHMTTNGRFLGTLVTYPQAISLRLLHDDMQNVGTLIDSFPNLEHLRVDEEDRYLTSLDAIQLREVRAQNVIEIARRIPDPELCSSWPVGENARFAGRARSLYLLGLSNVAYVELDAKAEDIEDIQVALHDAAPMDLYITLSVFRVTWNSLAELSCGGNLNILELNIVLDIPPLDCDRIIPCIIAMCRHEPICNLHLAFQEIEDSFWWMWLAQIDMPHLALVLATELQGLAQIHITAGKHQSGEWQVAQIGPGVVGVEELPVGHRDRWL
ncbi:hypothetical protein OBBRIDRAFT_797411 [Obba rivulosa]|uniref:F-box domain-containing protein n=1 Tax=Obba rivulosa TaxID=1052685 RepID=A0A8E2AKE1_9APHY|nr:hypothetical protein OBBRIDRAFT_797411 [Obba rivulosa]